MNFLCVWMHNPWYSKFTMQLYVHILPLTLSRASHDCRPPCVQNGTAILWLAEKTKVWQAHAERCSLGRACPPLSRAAPNGWPVPWARKPRAVAPSSGLSAAKCESREECLGGGWWFTWPASRHYDQQRPWACLACPHVMQAAGLFCCPLQRSQSISLRRSTRLHLLFLSEGATGKLLQQLFSLMAKNTHFIFAHISLLLWTGRGAWGFAHLLCTSSPCLASRCHRWLACRPGPGSPQPSEARTARCSYSAGLQQWKAVAGRGCCPAGQLGEQGNVPLLQRGRQRWAEPADKAVRAGRSCQPAQVMENVGRWVPH